MDLASRPISDKGAGVKQHFQQADDAVIMQLQSGYTPDADECWLSQSRELAAIDGASQQFRLALEVAQIGGGHPFAKDR